MPYIKPEMRNGRLDELVEDLQEYVNGFNEKVRKGVVNYVITRIVSSAFGKDGEWNYNALSDAISAFECAKLELYNRVGQPYEEEKRYENGDVLEYGEFEQVQGI